MNIVGTYRAGKYISLILSENFPFRPFNKVSVNGVTYPAELVYETDNEIAIIADDESGFVGKEILFEI